MFIQVNDFFYLGGNGTHVVVFVPYFMINVDGYKGTFFLEKELMFLETRVLAAAKFFRS